MYYPFSKKLTIFIFSTRQENSFLFQLFSPVIHQQLQMVLNLYATSTSLPLRHEVEGAQVTFAFGKCVQEHCVHSLECSHQSKNMTMIYSFQNEVLQHKNLIMKIVKDKIKTVSIMGDYWLQQKQIKETSNLRFFLNIHLFH